MKCTWLQKCYGLTYARKNSAQTENRRKSVATQPGTDADLRDLRRQSTPSATACPVCNSKCIDVQFQFGTDMFLKSVCDNCEHLFTNWSQTNVEENTSLFGYLQENENISVQAALLEEAAALSRGGRVLDFGTGANIRSIRVARKPTENTDYWACDLYQSDEKNISQRTTRPA